MVPQTTAVDIRVPLLLLLSTTTGLIDAASVLGMGNVFTANMTGNVVFTGFAAAGGAAYNVKLLVAALAGFMLGAFGGGRVARQQFTQPERRWLSIAATIEVAFIWGASLLAVGHRTANDISDYRLISIIVLAAMAMGFRNATVRQMKVADLTTTVLTLTLTGLGADSSAAGGSNPNWQRRLGAVAAIFIGAACGAWMLREAGLWLPLAVAGFLVLVGTSAYVLHPASNRLSAAN